jgi:hypothetical protein
MSSDYRPRGGSSSNGGPRRRRGGRGRGGANRHSGEHRPHTNGTSSNGSYSGAKKKGPIAAFFSWITGGGKKKVDTSRNSPARINVPENRGPDLDRNRGYRQDRPDRAERGPRPERAERPPREERPEPVPQEIVSPKLYVGNLAYEAVESDLHDLFSKVGLVKNVEIAMDRRSGRSKGFGFVEMEVIETAKEAAEKLNRTDFMGRQIVVSGAKMEKRSVNPHEESADSSNSSSDESSI